MAHTETLRRALQQWSGAAAVGRAAEVLARGALFDTRRTGTTLRARCHGSEGGLYHLSLTLSDAHDAVSSAHCSCPAGAEGRCKHTAALGLRYAAAPDSFAVVASVTESLRARSRAELVTLIGQMVALHPELDALVALPMPGRRADDDADARAFARQADSAFDAAGAAWGAEVAVVDALSPLATLARRFAEEGDLAGCLAVAEGLSESVYRHLPAYAGHSHADDLRGVVLRCVQAVGHGLARVRDESLRASALDWLLDTRARDLELGDVGPAEAVEALLVSATTASERGRLAARLAGASPGEVCWDASPDGALRFDLLRDTLHDDDFLAGCARLGRADEAVGRLLARGRWPEALDVARKAPLWAMLPVAEALVAHEAPEVAEALVLARAEQSRDPSLLRWLLARAQARGDTTAVRSLAETLIEVRPDLEALTWLRGATEPAQWSPARERALGMMLAHGRQRDYLEALLSEGLIARAVAHVRAARPSADLACRVAEAAAETLPAEAVAIWRDEVESLVARKNRVAYTEAAALVQQMEGTLRRVGHDAEASAYRATLRQRHPRLRALHETLEALDGAGT